GSSGRQNRTTSSWPFQSPADCLDVTACAGMRFLESRMIWRQHFKCHAADKERVADAQIEFLNTTAVDINAIRTVEVSNRPAPLDEFELALVPAHVGQRKPQVGVTVSANNRFSVTQFDKQSVLLTAQAERLKIGRFVCGQYRPRFSHRLGIRYRERLR